MVKRWGMVLNHATITFSPAVGHTCRTRPPRGSASACRIARDSDTVAAFLEDAAHYPGGHAAGIAYPRSEADVAEILRTADRVLTVGAQSSLTGGATPFGEVILSTARMNQVLASSAEAITVQPGVTLDAVQAALKPFGAVYPPTPTFTGASAGGSVSTNAAGAATFKYGSTRNWVEGLTVVLANGEVLELTRGQCRAGESGFRIECAHSALDVPVPGYSMPAVPKISAGYFAEPGMDLVDLFVGSEGTLGILTSVTLRALSPAPATALALVFCQSEPAGLALAGELRRASSETWRTREAAGIDVCAVECMDDRSLRLLADHGDLLELHVTVPPATAIALLVQLDLPAEIGSEAAYAQIESALLPDAPDTALVRFCRLLERFGLLDRTELAAPGDAHRQQQLLRFRESVPARVNQLVGAAKRTVDPRIEKTAADMIVPFDAFAGMMEIYRRGFASRGLQYAIWGHLSDGNVHPNVIPRTFDDVRLGKEAILEFGLEIARLGGCPLAEHGVGRNPVKQALLRQLYGDAGIEQMRAVKRALDPHWKLAPGVIFPE
jgi:D-lactate dehydrogenase (cytochrome)